MYYLCQSWYYLLDHLSSHHVEIWYCWSKTPLARSYYSHTSDWDAHLIIALVWYKISFHLRSLEVLFSFTIFYTPWRFSLLLIGSLDVLTLSKITLIPPPKSPLVLSKMYLKATEYAFMTPIIMWHFPMSSSMRTLDETISCDLWIHTNSCQKIF